MTRARRQHRRRSGPEPPFSCANCGRAVPGRAYGTLHRNHCPLCLCSLHVDIRTGDRRSGCGGVMELIAVWVRVDGEWALVHRCRRCGKENVNRVAGDDDEAAIVTIARRPFETRRGPRF